MLIQGKDLTAMSARQYRQIAIDQANRDAFGSKPLAQAPRLEPGQFAFLKHRKGSRQILGRLRVFGCCGALQQFGDNDPAQTSSVVGYQVVQVRAQRMSRLAQKLDPDGSVDQNGWMLIG